MNNAYISYTYYQIIISKMSVFIIKILMILIGLFMLLKPHLTLEI